MIAGTLSPSASLVISIPQAQVKDQNDIPALLYTWVQTIGAQVQQLSLDLGHVGDGPLLGKTSGILSEVSNEISKTFEIGEER